VDNVDVGRLDQLAGRAVARSACAFACNACARPKSLSATPTRTAPAARTALACTPPIKPAPTMATRTRYASFCVTKGS